MGAYQAARAESVKLLADVKAANERYGRCMVAVSEGIHDASGQPMLAKLAKGRGGDYATFWKEFGQVLKEGPAEDFANKEKIARVIYGHNHNDKSTQEINAGQAVGASISVNSIGHIELTSWLFLCKDYLRKLFEGMARRLRPADYEELGES